MKIYKNGQFRKKDLFLDEKVFILKNYNTMTYHQMLIHLNKNRSENNQLAYSLLRHRFRDLGLSRYNYKHWAKVHEKFLKENYKIMGNKQIAIILSSNKFRSKKVFTRQQVRKKMELLNLHRTPEELAYVVQRNIELGLTVCKVPKYIKQRILINKFKKRRNYEYKRCDY